MITVKIDDSQLQKFLKKVPERAEWALKETLKAAGAHLRKRIRNHIEHADGWPGLAENTIERKRKYNTGAGKYRTSPLEVFVRLVKFRYSKYKGSARVTVGFFNTRSWFKNYGGVGAATIAKLHETGSGSGKYGRRPLRPMIGPVWRKEGSRMGRWIGFKFYDVFFSNKKRGLKY